MITLHSVHILVVSYVAYYLAAHAMLTEFLWSQYPKRVDKFMTCAACSGAWWTLGAAALAKYTRGWLFFGLDAGRWPGRGLILALGCFLIPLLAWAHLCALERIHIPDPGPVTPPSPGGPDAGAA